MKEKQLVTRMVTVVGSIILLYILITKFLSPAIENAPDVTKGVITLVSTVIFMYSVNALLFAFSLEELRRVLVVQGTPFILNYLPLKADTQLRSYYSEFQDELGAEGLGSMPVVATILISIAFLLSALAFLPYTLYTEGILYATTELEFAFIVTVLIFGLLQIMRTLCLSKLIKMAGPATYMANPGIYLIISYIMLGGWAILFIAGPILSLIGINLVHPLLNILGLVAPIVVPAFLAYFGTRKMRIDLTVDYDMDLY